MNILIVLLPGRLPTQTQLLANYPNPFNLATWIPFELSQDSEVNITIYDVQGQLIRQLESGIVTADISELTRRLIGTKKQRLEKRRPVELNSISYRPLII
ncbi:hypothetical protein CMK18_08010 [Candidatus Poribacteria bacterium]|nr:hypothetical protein [Candidatus Poribacteria bacterium]